MFHMLDPHLSFNSHVLDVTLHGSAISTAVHRMNQLGGPMVPWWLTLVLHYRGWVMGSDVLWSRQYVGGVGLHRSSYSSGLSEVHVGEVQDGYLTDAQCVGVPSWSRGWLSWCKIRDTRYFSVQDETLNYTTITTRDTRDLSQDKSESDER